MPLSSSLASTRSRRFKRERSNEPILISSRSPSPPPRSSKRSRDRVFAALEHGNPFLKGPRSIQSADDLDEIELKRCFEILHACAISTDPAATLSSTRETMEGFLDAVFKEWTGDAAEDPVKPSMDFVLREYIAVGNICKHPGSHIGTKSCAETPACRVTVFVIATYRSKPAQLEIGFCLNEPSTDECEFFCPMERGDVRWDGVDWLGLLKTEIKRACIAKIHKYNKHVAVWQARKLAQGWARGSIELGEDSVVLAFVKREAVDAAFVALGDGA
ncbi:hypothetical protein B0T10DRAFT_563610 [Thelonectria olida]|uniref:Uncharacterized protein n=1 Tax=Thelonectria olida TaxID=1576542 RepID=A0A9P8W1E8_9HYPO|nr:hypothetical protein B0T10DRAFT_563610 [Thelonectria olida]